MKPKRVVFLMSDTGGGHRAAADAIRAAMDVKYPGAYTFKLVDVYRRYTPFPFRYMPEVYPHWVNLAPTTWGLSVWLINAHYRDRIVMALFNRLWRRGVRQMVRDHPADVLVSVHALFSRPAMAAWQQNRLYRPPLVTVITDLVSTPAFWYEKQVERCLVPTQAAYDRGVKFGLKPDQLRVTGLPVHPEFLRNLPDTLDARRRLGWLPDVPVVLLSGGADGMGPVYRIARELDRRELPMQLAIIAGRNRLLLRRLDRVRWHQPTYLYPYVSNMPELMAAADVLVTKAGPSTIYEAATAGLPVVLSGAVPGQEAGNVSHVVENGVGVYAPGATRVADTVAAWLAEGADGLKRRSEQAQALARPNAVWEIAEEIHLQAQRGWLRTEQNAACSGRKPRLRHTPEDGWVI